MWDGETTFALKSFRREFTRGPFAPEGPGGFRDGPIRAHGRCTEGWRRAGANQAPAVGLRSYTRCEAHRLSEARRFSGYGQRVTMQHMTRQDVRTIAYYDRNAPAFVADTVGVSMGAALTAFVELLPAGARVLDWGCGGGRDSRSLRRLGFEVTSVDASAAMAEEALTATGTIVRVESFGELDEVGAYDGIWACASLLHVRPGELPDVLASAARALEEKGVLYCSFKLGDFHGYRDDRWFTDLEEGTLSVLLEPCFDVVRMWASPDVRPGRGEEPWLNCLATRR